MDAILGAVDRYPNIKGGDTVDYVYESGNNSYTSGVSSVYGFVQTFMQDCKNAKQIFCQNNDYWYNLYAGKQWVVPNKGGGFRDTAMPSNKPRCVINLIEAVIDGEISTIFDNDPKPYIGARTYDQDQYVEGMQAALDFVWEDAGISHRLQLTALDAKIYGTGIGKLVWDPEAENGLGAVRCFNVALDNFLIDRDATSLDKDDFTAIIEIAQIPLSKVRQMYPRQADRIRVDGSVVPYQERKEVGGYGYWGYDSPSTIITPGAGAQMVDSQGPALFQTAAQGNDYLVEVAEMWIKDNSKKVVEEQYPYAMDQNGQIVWKQRQSEVACYPTGWRLIVVGGGAVLYDGPAPYDEPPYFMVRHTVLARRFWGIGVPEWVSDLQVEYNRRRSQIMLNGDRMGNLTWVYDEDALNDPNMDLSEIGAVISKKQNREVKRLSAPEMPSWYVHLGPQAMEEIFLVSGTGGAMGGATGKRSGSAVSQALSQETTRIRNRAKQVDYAIKKIARICVNLIQRFWTTPRWLRVMGTHRKAVPVPFDFRHARGQWDIKVESGSASASSKLARRQEAIQLLDKHVIGPDHALEALDWPNREQIATDMGFHRGPYMMDYMGWPGFPTESPKPYNAESVYAMAARYLPPTPPPMQVNPAQTQAGGHKGGGGGKHSQKQQQQIFGRPQGFPK